MPAPLLILVKHSSPQIIETEPPKHWRLSDEGRQRATALAHRLTPYHPQALVTSAEPKATETAQIVATTLNLPLTVGADLHEHDRSNVKFLGATEFQQAVLSFFEHPTELVLGQETAAQATARFGAAVDQLLAQHPQQTLVVIAHGTVISLYVSQVTGIAAYPLWQRLGLPSFVVLSRPTLQVLEVVEEVA